MENTLKTSQNMSPKGESQGASFVIEDNILKGKVSMPTNNSQNQGQIILDALNEHPDHVSQIDAETGVQTTNGEMKDRSIRCASWLKKLGIDAKDVIVACTHNHLDSYIPLLATIFVDAIFNGWPYGITIDTARFYMRKFKPKVIFVNEKSADLLLKASILESLKVEIVVFGKHSSLPSLTEILNCQTEQEIDNFTLVNVKKPGDISIIYLSSGSTGCQKGIAKSSGFGKRKSSENQPSRMVWYSLLDSATCVLFILTNIVMRQTSIIPSCYDAENLFQIVEKYKVNRVYINPAFLSYVARSQLSQKYDLSSLKLVNIGGSKCTKQIIEELQRKIPSAFICNAYACTEAGILSVSTPACKHVDSVGFVIENCQMKFVDITTGKNLGPNQHGEICVKTTSHMIGYYNDEESTKKAYDADGWYRTGDLGYYDVNGEIFIVDRIGETIKYKNYNILPAEIEEILLSHPDVRLAVVVGIPHEIDGQWPIAICKKEPDSKVTEDELLKLTSALEDYKQLRGGIHFVDYVPYTEGAKIVRGEVKRLARDLLKINNES